MVTKLAAATAFSPASHLNVIIRHSTTTTRTLRHYYHSPVLPAYGVATPAPENYDRFPIFQSPFRFETGYALRAKRPPRPFPPPFLSPPSSSFSDPLTTHSQSQDRRLFVKKELVRGLNNGDDAVLAAENFIGVNDGVGAWATRPRGHAALWSRLLIHFWALQVEREVNGTSDPDPVEFLQRAYEETVRATMPPHKWLGTTTSVTALLHWTSDDAGDPRPLLYVTNLGDSKVLVIRPSEKKLLFRTDEQWHWFDCPYQLGTNSIDTPHDNAVLSKIALEEDDIVLALSDGVTDNLWEQELLTITLDSVRKWEEARSRDGDHRTHDHGHGHSDLWIPGSALADERMVFVARELLKAACAIAQDPYSESPYMERAIDEGLSYRGGKMDDISVVVASCQRREAKRRPG
ncbi:hypothetical protein MAP00_001277 [Monascus purpureus]|nr:hypothetical protein MAP00_001277 [Monascus purpureus]